MRFQVKTYVVSVLFLLAVPTSAIAQNPAAVHPPPSTVENSLARPATEREQKKEAFLSKYFGVGVMANGDSGDRYRIESARVVSGIVRVEEETRSQIGFILEAHKFINADVDGPTWIAHGPFVGLVVNGEGSIIDAGILGWMVGFRRPLSENTLNLGVGWSITPSAKVLGDGIQQDRPLPTGETEVRYKKITKYGLAVTLSFGF